MYISFLIAFICFLIGALSGLFDWDLGDFNALAWGFVFLAFGHLAPGGVAAFRGRGRA